MLTDLSSPWGSVDPLDGWEGSQGLRRPGGLDLGMLLVWRPPQWVDGAMLKRSAGDPKGLAEQG